MNQADTVFKHNRKHKKKKEAYAKGAMRQCGGNLGVQEIARLSWWDPNKQGTQV